jgi:hypothetical protein
MGDGVVLQCARVDHLSASYDGSVQVACGLCRQRVWLSKPAVQLVRSDGVKPVCNVCRPARAVGPITPGK